MKSVKHAITLRTARIIAGTCMAFIIGFQVIWLYADYQNKKAQVLRRAENVLKEQLLQLEVLQIAGSVTLTNPDSSVTFDLSKLVDGGTDTAKRSEYLLQKGAYNAANVAISIPLHRKDSTVAQSEQLYKMLRKQKDFTAVSKDFAVIGWIKDRKYPYPAEAAGRSGEVTDIITPDLNHKVSYQLQFNNLLPVILADIKGSLILSMLYLLLAIATLTILMQSLVRSRRLMEMKTGFTYNMTHELKIPVSTLYAAIEALDRYDMVHDPEAARKYIRIMHGDVERLSGMIDTILTNARLEEGKITLRRECLQLKDVFATLQHTLSLQLSSTGAVIDDSHIPDQAQIYADKELIGNVFINLTDNALKYTNGKPRMYIAAQLVNDEVSVTFADNGPGIPRQYWQAIFEPYFRVPEADLHTVKGYGLGLSYAREIIGLHGGSIAVSQSNNTGTTFQITLPLCHG